jgi:hypothetical protein
MPGPTKAEPTEKSTRFTVDVLTHESATRWLLAFLVTHQFRFSYVRRTPEPGRCVG